MRHAFLVIMYRQYMAYLAFFTIVFQPLMGYNSYIIIKEFKPSAYIFGRFIFRYRGEFMGSNVKTYTKKELVGYLAGMFGQNLIYNIVSTGLYFYFQNVICLPAMALGWIMTIARIWDAINDPMMGTIVDKTKSKWGKCRPYLIISPA